MDGGIGNAEQCAARESLEGLEAEAMTLLEGLRRALGDYEKGLETAREIDEQLAALVVHMETRLGVEERCMRAPGVANRASHVADHRRALADARQTFRHWLQQRDLVRLGAYVHQHLPQWQAYHRRIIDRPAAAVVRRRESAAAASASLPCVRSS